MTTTSELEAYAKGFKDGWEAARKESMPNRNHLQPHMWKDIKIDPPQNYSKCPECGVIGVQGLVCYNTRCPTRIHATYGAGGQPTNVGVGGIGTTVPSMGAEPWRKG